MTTSSSSPDWLRDHLIRAGHITETGLTRHARLRRCHCGLWTLSALDGDRCALEAHCDPRPLTPIGEALAWLDHRRTWSLTRTRRFELDPRDQHTITHHPAGTQPRCDVLAQHACGRQLPLQAFGPSNFPETTPPLPAGTPPPF